MQELDPLGSLYSIKEAVQAIVRYLEDTGSSAPKTIYFDGWDGLAASAVLTAIAEDPSQSLSNKFDKIMHIDCTRWKSRRALQRAIADELKLPQSVMVAFDREDDEDDFSGVDEDSRAEIEEVGRLILGSLLQHRYLIVFHNGNTDMVDLVDFGIPQPLFNGSKILWTFTGRLRVNQEIKEKVDNSHLCIYRNIGWSFSSGTAQLILEEATEVIKHMQHKQSITPQITAKCITYILWLHEMGGSTMDYNWATHASNYWVCDGIMGQQGQFDEESWEVSAALHKQVQRMELSSRPVRFVGHEYTNVWKSVTYTSDSGEKENLTALSRNLTSLFLVSKGRTLTTLPHDMFQQSERLRVLKLSGCNFSFYSPPFSCCGSLRFLGLDHCEDQRREEEDRQGRPIMEFFQSLWVLDMNQTDWEFDLSQDLTEQMTSNIREIHIKKGRIWRSKLAWRKLRNLRKLRVIEPTNSWETGKKDEFANMPKLELLDLSGNSTLQVLPCLSSATCMRTLVLDGCVGLDHVGPEGLPPALETFSLDARSDKLLKISLSGCAKLESFLLRGELPRLEELNLSGTSIRRIDLGDKVVQLKGLKKVFLMGCKQLRAILWWQEQRQLEVLCINTFETEDTCPYYSNPSPVQHRNYVVTADARIIQSLLTKEYGIMITSSLYLHLHMPPTSSSNKSKGPSRDKVIPKPCYYTYSDVLLPGVFTCDNEMRWPAPLDYHMEVGQGISLTGVESDKGIKAIRYMTLDLIYSLHVHDNSCILAVTPKSPLHDLLFSVGYYVVLLKWCRVERCLKLETVFASSRLRYSFTDLKAIWVSDLPAATCIWSKGSIEDSHESFQALQSIHLHECPRLKFALPLSRNTYLPRLETLHITRCSGLKQVFPWDDDVVRPQQHREASREVKEFPKLKHVLLQDLFNLQEICEAKMTAPMLESVRIRECWGLRRLPAIGHRNNSHRRPVVHCQEDWWTKLEWDGLQVGHDPSLYEPRYSSAYYKKRFLRGTVLR
ncbi:hypothetical protein SORBI_3006G017200 [Sorghum bicolor]|uniref:Disease resistance protein At4g27190-like leucine-rich repeats domain-containing protein n=1 Tax=Sorghum bicolor TaxID=4558 RepID=C5YC83_SORBI|nr:hypothetical protein SORBI_3006G017200 [Sorghum bicolor]